MEKTLSAVIREKSRKGETRKLRRNGRIPAVIYGYTESKAISIDEREFNTKFHTVSESLIIKLNIGEDSHDVLIRDFQENILSGKIIHLDFYEVEKGKHLKTNVSVHLSGTSIGIKEGGMLETFVHDLEIECLPRDLPDKIILDITDLKIGDSIHVSEVPPIDGVRILNSSDQVICTVAYKRAEEVEEPEEEEVLEEEEVTEETEEE